MRKTLEEKICDYDKLKVENEDLKFKNEESQTHTEIVNKNAEIQKQKFLALQQELFKKSDEINDIQTQMKIKEDQILSHLKGLLQNFFKSTMSKTTKTSKVDTQEF